MKTLDACLTFKIAVPGLFLFGYLTYGHAADLLSGWEKEWERTLDAAKKEGQVNVYHNIGFEAVLGAFSKDYPQIKAVGVPGRGSQLAIRISAERRAGKYLADVYNAGANPNFNVLYKGGLLDSIRPALILPEVLDESKWYGGKHRYIDAEQQHIFAYIANSESVALHYNTGLAKPNDFASYWDLVSPKWKGKIISLDPRATGGVGTSLRFFYYHPELGPAFMRKFLGEMEIAISSDFRQMTDWLANGKFALCMGCRDTQRAKSQGLPVDSFDTSLWKEGGSISASGGSLSLFKQAPHPNAAKVFINWLLSRKGQVALRLSDQEDPPNSRRLDIPKDYLRPEVIPVEGRRYLDMARPEWSDLTPILKIVNEAFKPAK